MNTILEDNLVFLKKHYPNIYLFANGNSYNKDKYVVCDSKNDETSIYIATEQTKMFIHSMYNPTKEAEGWVNYITDTIEEVKNILVFGFGLGYHLQALIDRFPDKKIYIYEPDYELFLATIEGIDLRPILAHPNIATFAVGHEQSIRKGLLNYISLQISESFRYLILPIYNKTHKQLVEDFLNDTAIVLRSYRMNLGTVNNFQLNWLENILNNVVKNLISPSIQSLKSTFQGITAVIVGSGPSLQQDIEYLRKLKAHCLIIAAGSSIQALLHNQIEPHLVVSMDGSEANYRAFKDLDLSHIPLLYVPLIKYEILQDYNDNLIHVMFNSDLISNYLFDAVKDMPVFFSTSTVTGTAIQAAIHVGCNRVVLMGQDLSYPNNQYYTEAVDHEDEETITKALSDLTECVDNVKGEKNRTTIQMQFMLQNMESVISSYPSIPFINTSQMGANIKNTRWQPIEEIYEDVKTNRLEPDWFQTVLKTNLKRYDNHTINKVIAKVHKVKKEIQAIEKKLHVLYKQLKQLERYAKSGKGNANKLLVNVDKSWKWITNRKSFDEIYFFGMQHYMSLYMRYVPEIVEQQDSQKKADLIVNHLGALVLKLILNTPVYLSYFDVAIKKIEKQFPVFPRGDHR